MIGLLYPQDMNDKQLVRSLLGDLYDSFQSLHVLPDQRQGVDAALEEDSTRQHPVSVQKDSRGSITRILRWTNSADSGRFNSKDI